jgi:hypothetical protein
MPDPLSSVPRPTEGAGAQHEDTRIEQLLVTGLDHYFAGEFESAINLWTRVLFLDRTHDRARAYIERARSAQAEHQRQTEALVHQGLEAFDRGDVEGARSILSRAIERGASDDLALGVLGRIDRLDVPSGPATGQPRRWRRDRPSDGRVVQATGARPRRPAGWLVAAALLALALGAAGMWAWNPDAWSARVPPRRAPSVTALPLEPPPVTPPTATEVYLAEGRRLFAAGRVRDALLVLDKVSVGDPQRADADRLRATIQRELLALALTETAPAPRSAPPPAGRPPE